MCLIKSWRINFILFVFLLYTSCVDRKYVILVSDTHIGGDNFAGIVTSALPKFLRMMTRPETDVHTFVVVGDFIDLWGRNYSEPNPTPSELLKMQNFRGVNVSEYVDIMKLMMKNGVEVKYVRGNHDIQVQFSDLEAVGLGDVSFYKIIWEEYNFQVEHGNRFDLWCAPDPSNTILPFAYYVTRSFYEGGGYKRLEKQEQGAKSSSSPWYDWPCDHILSYMAPALKDVPWLYERVIGGALGESVWGELANKKYTENKHKKLVSGCVYSDWKDEVLERSVMKYTSTVRRFIEKYGETYTENLVRGMCDDASWFYKQIEKDLFVQGHLHTPEISLVKTNAGKDLVYANTGAWTISMDWLPFIRITQPNKQNATFVELMEINEKDYEFITRSSSFVPYKDSIPIPEYVPKRHNYNPENKVLEKEDIDVKGPHEFTKKPPEGWICDENWYNSNDGCDCGCGIPDPDCACTKSESCEYSCCSN